LYNCAYAKLFVYHKIKGALSLIAGIYTGIVECEPGELTWSLMARRASRNDNDGVDLTINHEKTLHEAATATETELPETTTTADDNETDVNG